MNKIILILLAFGLLFAGCAGGTKQCSDNACINDALRNNNCQEAVFEKINAGFGSKTEVSNKGSTCVVTMEVYSGGEKTDTLTCVYKMPVGKTDTGTCN